MHDKLARYLAARGLIGYSKYMETKMRRFLPYLVCCFLVAAAALARAKPKSKLAPPPNYVPRNGYVPNAKTAIKIAVAVWSPIYGEKQIQSERPYKASLKNGIWRVEGTLPKGYSGGVAFAAISKRDGRILNVFHMK